MKLLAGIVLFCFATATYAAPRIIGGKDAPEGAYKYQVSLRYSDMHLCGGSIIDTRWILTAAHCVLGLDANGTTVIAGTTLLDGGNEQVYQAEHLIAHKSFHDPPYTNDIALIRVSEDIEFNGNVQPIALPDEESYEVGDSVKLTGWGLTTDDGEPSNKLQEIDLTIFDQDKCREAMQDFSEIVDSHICTLNKAGEGFCDGDSGGPLVVDGIQIGIVSFSDGPCAAGKPDVFTRVYSFLDWIAAEQAKF